MKLLRIFYLWFDNLLNLQLKLINFISNLIIVILKRIKNIKITMIMWHYNFSYIKLNYYIISRRKMHTWDWWCWDWTCNNIIDAVLRYTMAKVYRKERTNEWERETEMMKMGERKYGLKYMIMMMLAICKAMIYWVTIKYHM